MNNNPIGVFDSGIGGLSVLRQIIKLLPNEKYIYYADTDNVPYGLKTKEQILEYVENAIDFLNSKKVKAIVVACNTATSVAIKDLRSDYNIPIIGIEPAIKPAIENRKNKKIIYLDEVWRLIGITSNKNVASFIYKIFKTIRKYGGSSVAITQDISDLFSLENGTYGKSIINNSSNKAFFSLEEENISILSEYTNLSEKEKVEIRSLKRGESLLFAGDEHILTKIECADYEKEIINEK